MFKLIIGLISIVSLWGHFRLHIHPLMSPSSETQIITRRGDTLSRLAKSHGYQEDVRRFARDVHFPGHNLNRVPVGLVLRLPGHHPPLEATMATSGFTHAQRERLSFLGAIASLFLCVALARRHDKPFAAPQTPRRSVAALDRLDSVFSGATKTPVKKAA